MADSEEKIQIVGFSTNDAIHSQNDILQILFDQYNHMIIKKSRHAISFSLVLPNKTNATKIMLCTLSDLTKEYPGIDDVNCYLIFIDLQHEKSKQTFDSIVSFLKNYCNLQKKIYILGIVTDNGETNQIIHQKDIKKIMDSGNFYYKYIMLNLEDKKNAADSLLNIFIMISQEGTDEYKFKKKHHQAHSCNVF